MTENFKIIPAEILPLNERVNALRTYLSANIDVAIADQQLEKAAQCQQHLDTVNELAN